MTLKHVFLSAVGLAALGVLAPAVRADGYVVARAGASYAPSYVPAYVSYPSGYVAAQGYYSYAPSPVYAAPAYVPSYSYCPPVYRPVCEPPVVIYRPPVDCREPVRIFR